MQSLTLFAVALHGYRRATQDIDIMIREDDLAEAERLLEPVGYCIPAGMILFGTGTLEK